MSEELNFQRRYYLSKENIDYIELYKYKHTTQNTSAALRLIIQEHQAYSNRVFDLSFLVESIKDELISNLNRVISEAVSEELKRVRLATNNADRNSQILIELLHGWMIMSNVDAIPSTENMKSSVLKFAEDTVHNRISNLKQKRDLHRQIIGGN